ncbi:VanZ family protein [Nocardioides sp. Y6]|uniref:VanZ family protein n=2 Tax=Nocardioides malaquae TaxID=2773426 RepID=A0ABR9RWL4_9ACTN|nr:VanZ family protein [Nocardioides malaquae]
METMLAGVAVVAVVCLLLGLLLRRRLPAVSAWAIAGFVGAVACIGVLTLTPAYEVPTVIAAEDRPETCSLDYGGPSPEGFWIVGGGQRLLNMVVFVPAGALLVVACARWRAAYALVPLGLLGLVAYSVAIEWLQLELARIDRACDVTDMVDNSLGAVVGVGLGLLLAVVLRPWRSRPTRGQSG